MITYHYDDIIKQGWGKYLKSLACNCRDRYRLLAIRNANGVVQYKLNCLVCGNIFVAVSHDKISSLDIMNAKFSSNIDMDKPCAKCGSTKAGVEIHHWAPMGIFKDADAWPKSWLCRECHTKWHTMMNGYRWVQQERWK